MAVKAYILITADTAQTKQVVDTLRRNPKLREVNEVLGPFDIIVEMEAPSLDGITSTLREEVRPIPGIRNTLTCVVMRS
jgi:DNA-binding Lrp family transcriptional regulator